ncbi:MAG: putative lipid II flippase FtsW [Bdellovibrionaceae bacterium]|nr:putative lipid II flippase FtsW [Pseudobdellovibrionaceae bacterium]
MVRVLSNSLLLAVLMLMGLGLVQVYSSSFIYATEQFNDGLFFFKRQLVFVFFAFLTLLFVMRIPAPLIEKYGWLLWPLAAVLVALTFLPGVGIRVGGAIRWIQTPFGFRIEPSEILKIAFPLLFASILARERSSLKHIKWWVLLILFLVPLVLVLKQPDFGTFAIITLVAVGLLFGFGLRWRYVIAGFALVVPVFYFLVMNVPYRRARVMAFLDPWSDPTQKGFQVIQSMLSLSSGGIKGVGLGQGQGKLFFLPEAHTDFTLAVFGEEMGFIGIFILMALYGFVVFRGFQIAIRVSSSFFRALALGLTLVFAFNVLVNAGVVLGLLPTKGLTLPFLSYGGSSLISLSILFGLLLRIDLMSDRRPILRRGHGS